MLVHNTACKPYEVGTYEELKAKSDPNDGLDIHHVPQKHPAGQVIDGYDYNTGPAIALPRNEHLDLAKFNQKGIYTGSADDLITSNLLDLLDNTNTPQTSIDKLTELIDSKYR